MLKWLEGLNWLAVVSILVAIEIQITNGTISFTHWLPPLWIDRVKELAGDLATIGSLAVGGGAIGRIPGNQVIKMAIVLIAAGSISFFAFTIEVRAGDLLPPVKAPIAASVGNGSPCTPTSCTGFYVGGAIGGNGSNLDIVGSGINGSVFAGGVVPDAHVGYIYKQGSWLFGAETGVGYFMNSGVNVNGAGVNNNGLFSYQVARAGGDLGGLFGSQQPISIPPQLAASLLSAYGQLGIAEKQFAGFYASGMVSGAGAFFDIGAHAFINIDYKHISLNSPSSAFVTAKSLDIVTAGFNYKF